MNSTIVEYINGMEVVKVFNRDGDSYKRFETDVKNYRGQQKFNGFDVVNEHLFEDAHALLLNRPQGLCLQLFLKGDADAGCDHECTALLVCLPADPAAAGLWRSGACRGCLPGGRQSAKNMAI